ncbi:hypothetical protein BMS3Bbin14_02145 [bacterium BMS3Bbin14]|nr:hypothetical protein BMS3Abin13_02235 [bacterium BMS3Abin13]GBE53644.1 hypothetical protein BMS3Bbin14_02145 [bacterium BMS3Bbin14]
MIRAQFYAAVSFGDHPVHHKKWLFEYPRQSTSDPSYALKLFNNIH